MKTCTKCGETKPLSGFYADRRTPGKTRPSCKKCCNRNAADWASSNPEKIRNVQKKSRLFRRDQILAAEKLRRSINPEKYAERAAVYRDANRQACRDRYKAWLARNPEKAKAASARWKEKNAARTRELSRASAKAWKQSNRGKARAHEAAREAAKIRATPLWADKKKIEQFYIEAARLTKETGILHHVDHIFPLNSKFVCGLHCEANLQVLTAFDNISKGNRRWPGMVPP